MLCAAVIYRTEEEQQMTVLFNPLLEESDYEIKLKVCLLYDTFLNEMAHYIQSAVGS